MRCSRACGVDNNHPSTKCARRVNIAWPKQDERGWLPFSRSLCCKNNCYCCCCCCWWWWCHDSRTLALSAKYRPILVVDRCFHIALWYVGTSTNQLLEIYNKKERKSLYNLLSCRWAAYLDDDVRPSIHLCFWHVEVDKSGIEGDGIFKYGRNMLFRACKWKLTIHQEHITLSSTLVTVRVWRT